MTLAAGELRMALVAEPAPPSLNKQVRPSARTVEITFPPATGGYPILGTPAIVGEYLSTYLLPVLSDPREHAYVLALSCKGRLLCDPYLLSIGSDNTCLMDPKAVYRTALALGAFNIMLCHTHPSGICEPSREDREVTQRMKAAGMILGIELIDHVIVAGCHRTAEDPKWYSFRKGGLL